MPGEPLSTALVAGYYGLLQGAGLSDGEGNPSWAYNDRAALNPVTSGSNDNVNGSCSAPILYACTAGPGYNGPSGNGTISGDVVVGRPGIAGPARSNPNQIDNTGSYVASTTPTTVTLDGGVYPNQLDTTYWVQYGATPAYGQSTTPVDVGSGSGAVAVTSTITGLVSGDTYHYRLVAENADGISYGYDYTMSPLAAVALTFNGYGTFNLSGRLRKFVDGLVAHAASWSWGSGWGWDWSRRLRSSLSFLRVNFHSNGLAICS